MMKAKARLDRAEDHIFSTGLNDASSIISKHNMKYGLAKMHHIQEKYGFEPNATFISSPDETITRNAKRWEAGISYGGKVTWGNGREKFVFLDVKPNACGMLVGGLNKIPRPKDIIKKIEELETCDHYIKDVPVKWDFWKGNHFIDIFKVESSKIKLPKYVVVMHAGCSELKGDNVKGFGLYWHSSRILYQMCYKVRTPFGMGYVLEGSNAKDYLKFYEFAEYFAKKRREIAYKELFNGSNIILDECHQGMLNLNEISLGCNHIKKKNQLFPVSIRADLPSFLMKGQPNLTKDHIEGLGFKERADELGVYKRLLKANILPHGGGYAFQDSLRISHIFEASGKRFFEIELADGLGRKIVSSMHELQFSYRGLEVVNRTLELGLGKVAARLIPVYTLKI